MRYRQILLDGRSQLLHKLIAEQYIANPENKAEVNHINGDKRDNRIENLEWTTPSENSQHAYDTGLASNAGEDNPRAKVTDEDVSDIRMFAKAGIKIRDIKKVYPLSHSSVYRIIKETTWTKTPITVQSLNIAI